MSQDLQPALAPAVASFSGGTMTPAGFQSAAELRRRRVLVLGLTALTWLLVVGLVARVMGANGFTSVDILFVLAAAVAAPWTVLGFWNAAFGLWLLHGTKDPLARVAPFLNAENDRRRIASRTAILLTIRNEDPVRALRRLDIVKASLDATGSGDRFAYFVLSDTSSPDIAAAEKKAVMAWKAKAGRPGDIVYRRRTTNEGFKAGNLRDFCRRWGHEFEFMVPLDADSLMTGETVLRMVRVTEAHPRIGILQSLIVGLPTTSAFGRIFQFGMRHGMRAYTMGSAWWAGDCGPFWGHNAVVRVAPFRDVCELPILPGEPPLGGRILSHDQVEAVLMRRAGYEVRVLPVESGSFEENPPTLLEFMRRDLRWCQGNMQYWRLIGLPGLLPMSRFQLVWAILMFVGVPAWTLMIALAALKPYDGEDPALFPASAATALYGGFLLLSLAPKLAGLADVLLTRGGVARYGGPWRFSAGALIEIAFAFLIGAASTFKTTFFMIGLLFGRAVGWGGQMRDAHAVSWREACLALWPEFLFGLNAIGLLGAASPAAALWGLPLLVGYFLAVPLAVATADPRLGRLFARWRLCGIPEEFAPPSEVAALGLGQDRKAQLRPTSAEAA